MSLEDAEAAIPAVVRMFSGCEDKQTSADGESVHHSGSFGRTVQGHLDRTHTPHVLFPPVSNVASFRLPDPAGRAGGALTSALLSVTYADHSDTGADLTFKETLFAVREKLKAKGFAQIPQLSSSRPTNLDEKFALVPDGFSGTRRAVMIG